MRFRRSVSCAVLVGMALSVASARAGDTGLEDRVERIEKILEDAQESERPNESDYFRIPEWVRTFRISGNADVNYLYGQSNSLADKGRFAVENTRLFFDIDLGGESRLAGRPVLRAASAYIEWDLVRHRFLSNRVGSMYVRLDGLFNSKILNLKVGRMPLPFGEEYLRFHDQRPENPLISYSAPAPYNWDEGVMLFGSLGEGRMQYMFAVTDGDAGFNVNSNSSPQLTTKLVYEPFPWLHASLSGTRIGALGDNGTGKSGKSALEWGGTHATPVGIGSVDTFQDGVMVAADPSAKLDSVYAWEADLVFSKEGMGRLWLAAGQAYIESGSSSFYDRDLSYWIAEGIFELGALSELLDHLYAAVRYSAIGTLDSNEGYSVRAMNNGGDLGFNTKRVDVVSAGIGVRLNDNVTLKTEYSWFDFDVVRGVTSDIRSAARAKSYFGVGLTLGF